MKTIGIILITVLSLKAAIAQDFKISDNYYVALHGTLDKNNQEQLKVSVHSKTPPENEVAFFPVTNTDMIHSINISVLENPNLNGVKRVLKIDVNYVEYCTYRVSNYVLQTKTDAYISLPVLTNEDCQDNNMAMVYLFPSQPFGKENQILTSQITVVKNTITEALQEATFIWNDDTYGTSGILNQDF